MIVYFYQLYISYFRCVLVWHHVSRSGNSSWEGRACADIKVTKSREIKEKEVLFDNYKTDEFLNDYDSGNSTIEQDAFEFDNSTFRGMKNAEKGKINNDTESAEIPKAMPYIEYLANDDNQILEPIAEHRQMDIQLDEIIILENPEMNIFPSKEAKHTSNTQATSTTTNKPREPKQLEKTKSCGISLQLSILLFIVFSSLLRSL